MEEITSSQAPRPVGPYSQAIKSNGLMFCSGQIALDPNTGQIVPGGIREQTHQVINNIARILEASGTSLSKVVKTTVFLSDLTHFQAFNEVYSEYFSRPFPARTTVQAAKLPRDALVEIEAIAEL